jgi:hypothetical protein
MPAHALVVRALLTTTARAWSIDARVPAAEHDVRLLAPSSGDRGRARHPAGPTLSAFGRADPRHADEAPRAPGAGAT